MSTGTQAESLHAFQAGDTGSNPVGDTGVEREAAGRNRSKTAGTGRLSSPRPHHDLAFAPALPEREASPVGSVVYFLQRDSGGPIKVGTTHYLPQRRVQIAKALGVDRLRLVGHFAGDRTAERAMHEALAEWRVPGEREWFEPTSECVERMFSLKALAEQLSSDHRFVRAVGEAIYSVERAAEFEAIEEQEDADREAAKADERARAREAFLADMRSRPAGARYAIELRGEMPDNHRQYSKRCRCEVCLIVGGNYRVLPRRTLGGAR